MTSIRTTVGGSVRQSLTQQRLSRKTAATASSRHTSNPGRASALHPQCDQSQVAQSPTKNSCHFRHTTAAPDTKVIGIIPKALG